MKSISLVLFIFFTFSSLQQLPAQEEHFMRMEYIKLPTNDWNAYWSEIQVKWKPLYQEMITHGEMEAWKLFWVRFPAGTEIHYDIVNITYHKDSVDMANNLVSKFYNKNKKPDEDSFSEFEKPLLNSANRVKVETYEVLLNAVGNFEMDSLAKTNQNYGFDFMDASRENALGYVQMEKETFKPMHEAVIQDKRLKSWSLVKRISQDKNAVLQRFITINQWSSWANWQSGGGLQDFQKVNPSIDQEGFNEIFRRIGRLRQMTKSEMWSIWDEL